MFWTTSNIFKLCPTHFSRAGENFLGGAKPPGYRPALDTGNGRRSRLRRLKNGVPTGIRHGTPSLQRSHLWPANHRLQKACICWRKYAYPDDNYACWWRLAGSGRVAKLGHGNRRWIHPDLEIKHSTTKTVSAIFHLNNKEAKRELKVTLNNKALPFCSEPKYLGVTLDRSLTYGRHRESLRIKLISRVALVRRLSGGGWVRLETTDLLNEAHVECWHKLRSFTIF